jgi:hypothetical protein
MSTKVQDTAEFGDLVAAAFDGAASYSADPLVVSRLATGAVSLVLRHMRKKTILMLLQKNEDKATGRLQLA